MENGLAQRRGEPTRNGLLLDFVIPNLGTSPSFCRVCVPIADQSSARPSKIMLWVYGWADWFGLWRTLSDLDW